MSEESILSALVPHTVSAASVMNRSITDTVTALADFNREFGELIDVYRGASVGDVDENKQKVRIRLRELSAAIGMLSGSVLLLKLAVSKDFHL